MGETEGNLEHVLSVLRSLGPVVVIVDEAHHIRNAETFLHQGVRYFCDNAQASSCSTRLRISGIAASTFGERLSIALSASLILIIVAAIIASILLPSLIISLRKLHEDDRWRKVIK